MCVCVCVCVVQDPRGRSVGGSKVNCRWTEASSNLRCIKPCWPCGTYCWTPAGTSAASLQSLFSVFWKQTRNASEHLQDLSCAWVQDSDSSVFGRDGQPAAIAVEADRQQQRVRRVAVVDGHQNHSDRVPEHRACLGHIPEEDLKRDKVRVFLPGEFIWA